MYISDIFQAIVTGESFTTALTFQSKILPQNIRTHCAVFLMSLMNLILRPVSYEMEPVLGLDTRLQVISISVLACIISSPHRLHQVSPQEMVQEIHQVLMDREDTCHRTCFSLQLDGNVLDNFAELKSIEGLQEGSLLKVVEGEIWRLSFAHFHALWRQRRKMPYVAAHS